MSTYGLWKYLKNLTEALVRLWAEGGSGAFGPVERQRDGDGGEERHESGEEIVRDDDSATETVALLMSRAAIAHTTVAAAVVFAADAR